MSIYYIDGSNGAGVDSAGRGLTPSDPYLTPQFALDDAAASHTPGNTDLFKVIGTVTPTADVDFTAYDAASGNQYPVFISDGATTFGTHSYANDVRATWDMSSNGGVVVNDDNLDDVAWAGFELTGMANNVYPWNVDNFCNFSGLKADFTGLGFDRPKLITCDAGSTWIGSRVIGASNTSSGTYTMIHFASNRSMFSHNYVELGGTNPTAFVTNLSSYGVAHSNYLNLSGAAAGMLTGTTSCQVFNNAIFGSTKSTQAGIRVTAANPYGTLIYNNHFENLSKGVTADNGNFGYVVMGPNSYYNVDDPRHNMTTTEHNLDSADIALAASGFVDLAGGDLRMLEALQGLGLMANMPNPYFPADDIGPGTRVQAHSPYTNPYYRV